MKIRNHGEVLTMLTNLARPFYGLFVCVPISCLLTVDCGVNTTSIYHSVLNVEALVGAFSMIMNLHVDLRLKL